jgi:Bacterial SCP ortholog
LVTSPGYRGVVPVRLRPLPPDEVTEVLARVDTALGAGQPAESGDLRLAVRHFLAVLSQRAPGKSVEVRVPPYAAVQCIEGARHTRGTPPAVVETDALTWLALARGQTTFLAALDAAQVRASGERSDLTPVLPLT